MSQTDRSCPDSATIAAFVDGTLDQERANTVLAHIDACDECLVAIGDASAFVRQETAAERGDSFAFRGLAAAAALLVIVGGAALLLRARLDDLLYRETINPIIKAQRHERQIEGRLVGLGWSRLHDVSRGAASIPSDRDQVSTRVAATEVLESTKGKSAPRQRHAAGVATLLLDQQDEAIALLQLAARAKANDATLWSDLAAAYLDAARRSGRAGDLRLALAAADRALQINPRLAEALFNRALVLEKLERREEAAAAWRQYLDADSTSGWAGEARDRLNALERPMSRSQTTVSPRPTRF